MNVESYIEHLKSSPSFMKNVTSCVCCPRGRRSTPIFPLGWDARLVAALARRGIERPYIHQRLAMEAALAGGGLRGGSRPRPRARRSATTCPFSTPFCKTRPTAPSTSSPPRRFPATGGGTLFPHRGYGRGGQGLHLRWRHSRLGAHGHSSGGPRGGSPTRTCSIRASSRITPSGSSSLKPPIRGHRRDPRLSRRVRLQPRQRHPPLKARLRLLRLPSHVYLLLGHHRQPARTRRSDDRPPRAPYRRKRRARGRAPRGLLRSAGRQPPTRHPRRLHPGNAQHRRRAFARRGAVHRLCPAPASPWKCWCAI